MTFFEHRNLNSKMFFAALVLVLILSSCNNPAKDEPAQSQQASKDSVIKKSEFFAPRDCDTLYLAAVRMDSILHRATEANDAEAQKAVKVFLDFAYYCEQDTMSAVYLIKAAMVAKSVNNLPQAKLALEQCMNNYRSFGDRPVAMFLLAQLYDEENNMNNEAEAGALYHQIIQEYPKSYVAANAKAALQMLGKSDQEMIKEFNKKGKK